jgi:hypothetical protein
MTKRIAIRPAKLASFGDPEGASFCLVTNSAAMASFELVREGGYADYGIYAYDQEGAIARLLREELPARAHVLVISPGVFFRSPNNEDLGEGRKLLALAMNSTETGLDAIEHFVGLLERTRPDQQEEFAEQLFAGIEEAEQLLIQNDVLGTSAVFRHWDGEYHWNQQAGLLNWGGQQIAPPGEISVLPADIWDFDASRALKVDGTIALHGHPILHSGEPSFLRADQRRIWEHLVSMREQPVIATVVNGLIERLDGASAAVPAIEYLEKMFAIDSRYRVLWELGFAVNTTHQIFPGNHAMNEVHGGRRGVLHFGLGLTPYTQYHLDVICPGTCVRDQAGRTLLGSPDESPASSLRVAREQTVHA